MKWYLNSDGSWVWGIADSFGSVIPLARVVRQHSGKWQWNLHDFTPFGEELSMETAAMAAMKLYYILMGSSLIPESVRKHE